MSLLPGLHNMLTSALLTRFLDLSLWLLPLTAFAGATISLLIPCPCKDSSYIPRVSGLLVARRLSKHQWRSFLRNYAHFVVQILWWSWVSRESCRVDNITNWI